MATNMKSLNGYGFDAQALGGYSLSEIMLMLYPVGAVYTSTVDTSPASLFGGTWEQLQDRFLLAAGSTYSAGSTGGEATHTLTKSEIPEHRHDVAIEYSEGVTDFPAWYFLIKSGSWSTPATAFKAASGATTNIGGSMPHNNMPPYLAVYMWKRVS